MRGLQFVKLVLLASKRDHVTGRCVWCSKHAGVIGEGSPVPGMTHRHRQDPKPRYHKLLSHLQKYTPCPHTTSEQQEPPQSNKIALSQPDKACVCQLNSPEQCLTPQAAPQQPPHCIVAVMSTAVKSAPRTPSSADHQTTLSEQACENRYTTQKVQGSFYNQPRNPSSL